MAVHRWGLEVTEKDLKDPRLAPPLCYDGVRTCRFCAQFFGDTSYKQTTPSPARSHSPIKAGTTGDSLAESL